MISIFGAIFTDKPPSGIAELSGDSSILSDRLLRNPPLNEAIELRVKPDNLISDRIDDHFVYNKIRL